MASIKKALESLSGKIQDLRFLRIREKVFRPFFITPYKKTSYDLEELVLAMYQVDAPPEIYLRPYEIYYLLGFPDYY